MKNRNVKILLYHLGLISSVALLLWIGPGPNRGIFLSIAGADCEQHGAWGMQTDGAASTKHCECLGRKVKYAPLIWVEGINEYEVCVGVIREQWVTFSGPSLIFNVDPPTSTVTITSNKSITDTGLPIVKIDGINMEKTSEPYPGQKYKYQVNKIDLIHPYENRKTGTVFLDKFPIHIEVTNPGYKPWSTDFIPQSVQIFVNVRLEKEKSHTPKNANKKLNAGGAL